MNFALYEKRATGDIPDLAVESAGKREKSMPYKPWSASLRARIEQSATLLAEKKGAMREEALAPLFAGMEKAADWRERHFTLLPVALLECRRSLVRRG